MSNIYRTLLNRTSIASSMSFGSGSTLYQGTNTSNDKLNLPTVYRCVNFLADAVANLPLLPYKLDGDHKVVDYSSSLYKLLKIAPSDQMSAYMLKRMIVYSMLVNGNAYVLINRSGSKVASLEYVDPARVAVVAEQLSGSYSRIKRYKIDGIEKQPSEVLHFINYTKDGVNGISTIEMIKDTLWIAKSQQSASIDLYKSGLVQAGYLSAEAGVNIDTKQKQQIRESWVNVEGIKVLDRGLKFVPLTISPQQAQMIENSKYTDELILAAFGLKLSNMFNISGPYGSVEQNQIDFLNNTLNPIIQKIESEIERKLDVEVNFDVNQILRSDRSALTTMVTALIDRKVLTPMESRELFGFEPNEAISDQPINNEKYGEVNKNTE